MPRHLQQWAARRRRGGDGRASWRSRDRRRSRATTTDAVAPTAVVDPNQQRIEEYQRRIQEQAQRLAAEQAQLQLTKEAVSTDGASATSASTGAPAGVAARLRADGAAVRTTREDLASHVADNVAFSQRPEWRRRARFPAEPQAPATLPPFVWPWRRRRCAPVVRWSAHGSRRARLASWRRRSAASTRGGCSDRCNHWSARGAGTALPPVRRHVHRDGPDQSARWHVQRPGELSRERAGLRSRSQHLVIPAGARVLGEARRSIPSASRDSP